MPVTLTDVERMAREIARDEDPALEVVAARNGEGAADYTEVIFTLDRNQDDPVRLVIGVTRNAAEDDIRRLLRSSLRDHLQALS